MKRPSRWDRASAAAAKVAAREFFTPHEIKLASFVFEPDEESGPAVDAHPLSRLPVFAVFSDCQRLVGPSCSCPGVCTCGGFVE